MNCSEVRDQIFAFLDNEIDGASRVAFVQHLEHCPNCSRDCEIERTISGRLRTELCLDLEIASALEALDPGHRKIIVLSTAFDLNYSDLAAELGCSVRQAMCDLGAARHALGEQLAGAREARVRELEALN